MNSDVNVRRVSRRGVNVRLGSLVGYIKNHGRGGKWKKDGLEVKTPNFETCLNGLMYIIEMKKSEIKELGIIFDSKGWTVDLLTNDSDYSHTEMHLEQALANCILEAFEQT